MSYVSLCMSACNCELTHQVEVNGTELRTQTAAVKHVSCVLLSLLPSFYYILFSTNLATITVISSIFPPVNALTSF